MAEDGEKEKPERGKENPDAEIIPFKRPIHWSRLRADEAQTVIRERVRKNRFFLSDHAFERLDERDLTTVDVLAILRTGDVQSAPVENEHKDWEVVVVKRMPGGREAGAATIIFRDDDTILVKTVMWMDPK